MDKKTAISKITVTKSRARTAGPHDTFCWFVDAPAGWAFEGHGGIFHHFSCENEEDALLSAECGTLTLTRCTCGCSREAE